MLLLLLLAQVSTVPRRQATVVLRAPCLAEYLMAGDKTRAHQRMMSAEGVSYRAGLRRAKAPLVDRMRQRGIPVTAQVETILNAVMADATDDDVTWLRAQPEVQAADFAIQLTAGLDAATSLIGAPQIWTQLGGQDNTGKGIKIGVVDSGIDIGNPMFSDAGFPASTLPGNSYTNNKVIIAKNYVVCSQDSSCNPTFDSSPADGYGHGSHVASIAAGRCAPTPLGTTICGVAPGAFLGSYKVFDATNHYATSTWVLNALDDAVADGMDVINFSGGSINNGGFGTQPGNAFLYAPIHNAASLGVVISICAGNCGPIGSSGECGTLFGDGSIWTPAVEPDAISVGAITNSHFPAHTLKVAASVAVPSNLQSIGMTEGSFPSYSSDFGPAPLVNVTSVDATGLACSALSVRQPEWQDCNGPARSLRLHGEDRQRCHGRSGGRLGLRQHCREPDRDLHLRRLDSLGLHRRRGWRKSRGVSGRQSRRGPGHIRRDAWLRIARRRPGFELQQPRTEYRFLHQTGPGRARRHLRGRAAHQSIGRL